MFYCELSPELPVPCGCICPARMAGAAVRVLAARKANPEAGAPTGSRDWWTVEVGEATADREDKACPEASAQRAVTEGTAEM